MYNHSLGGIVVPGDQAALFGAGTSTTIIMTLTNQRIISGLHKLNVKTHWGRVIDYNSTRKRRLQSSDDFSSALTHWGRVTHLCVSKLTTIGSDNGLAPGRRQAIIWTYAGILLIRPLGTNFNEMLIEILTLMRLKMSSATWRLFGLGLNELMCYRIPCDWSSACEAIQNSIQITIQCDVIMTQSIFSQILTKYTL